MTIVKKFNPQEISKIRRLREWIKIGKKFDYNWTVRINYPILPIYKIGARLHYLADHSPAPVRTRWKSAFRRFCQRYRKF